MSKKNKTIIHLASTEDIARSILLGVKVTTACGQERQYTREYFDSPLEGPRCQRCMNEFEVAPDGAVIIQRRGWLDIVERVLRARLEDETRTPSASNNSWLITAQNVGTWTNGTDWTRVVK